MRRFAMTIMTAGVLAGLVACSVSQSNMPASAEIEAAGMQALQGKQAAAFRYLEKWAQAGVVKAQRELALARSADSATYAEAAKWLKTAAQSGDNEAQFALAEAYYKAQLGLEKNYTEAKIWYQAAAIQNNAKAAFMLARMSKYGEGTRASADASVTWLLKASELGHAQAMFLLSNAYETGDGIKQDKAKARDWLEQSAEGEFPPAIHALALLLETENTQHTDRQRARHLLKEASDERLLRWNRSQ
ncbi:tetratricopeptide repeat protein [Undibacterium rugosum]|uniref:Sel1 repeat family protein n=1 Tax=Undibacterium rugosum TaxID=2762291 RepID=A0A923I3L6_9BURK|nr:tetratricopeptide repeat protein [Undibacterium rugosum]MBC3935892.1 sel1 repeat family protein [Undibacterium rugosum]MBR7779326.1 sel1 repeat family protein [Undibacterium rugosum]